MNKHIGLIGTITHDVIANASGYVHEGLGGVLYQAAVLCALEENVSIHTNLGSDLEKQAGAVMAQWPTLDTRGLTLVSGPANRVRLRYPEGGERVEILESVVPSLNAMKVLDGIRQWDMGILVCNSGFDIAFEDWRRIIHASPCPFWLDIHSLALSKEVGCPRTYVPLSGWKDWVAGVSYLQANRIELSCMLGHPGRTPSETEISDFAAQAFTVGVEVVFITLGREGVQVITPSESQRVSFSDEVKVVDTTGCGDVFGEAAAVKSVRGTGAFEAARFGVRLAAMAAGARGVEETYGLISLYHDRVSPE